MGKEIVTVEKKWKLTKEYSESWRDLSVGVGLLEPQEIGV